MGADGGTGYQKAGRYRGRVGYQKTGRWGQRVSEDWQGG